MSQLPQTGSHSFPHPDHLAKVFPLGKFTFLVPAAELGTDYLPPTTGSYV